MVTPKVDTALARIRREAKQVRETQKTAPITFVIPPITELLDCVQAVAGNELKRIMEDQQAGSRLSEGDARKLAVLTDAVVKAHGAGLEFDEAELGEMSDEQLEQEYVAELERIRAKKARQT